ncbi:uncharacterized protein LOC117323459 [Pecten maximus]|uniref:uncharacterized protein LOC117323459 n=1 Tax=Pecten maximus TaxID=6579 RepID=UPI001458C1C6|nr:uncharacterized protein LOC117323459 [Pecten maximus]
MASYQGPWVGGRGRGRGGVYGFQESGGPQNQTYVGHQHGGLPYNYEPNGEFHSPPQDRGRSNDVDRRQNFHSDAGQGHNYRSPSPKHRNKSPRSEGRPRNNGGGGGGGGSSWGNRRGNNYDHTQSSHHQMTSPDGRHWNRNPSSRGSQWDNSQGGWGGRQRDYNSDVDLSKKLSFLLRHGAERQGFTLMSGGFLYVADILKLPSLKGFQFEDVKRVVENNDKQRFALKIDPENKRMMIRANQGHTIEVQSLELTPITTAEEADQVVHGTYFQSWEVIKGTGLSRMGRNHIHFAAGEPGENGVISGMRSSCEVIIILDMKKALADGLKFFRSANNVILCEGDSDGIIYPAYFEAVIQRYPRHMLQFDKSITKDSAKGSPPKGRKKNKAKKREREEDNEGGKKKAGHNQKKEKKEDTRNEEVDFDLDVMFLDEKDSSEDISEARSLRNEKTAVNTPPENEKTALDTPTENEKTAVDTPPENEKTAVNTPPDNLKLSQPGPIVSYSDDDDDDDQYETASDVKVEEDYEITRIYDNQLSVSAVDNILEKESPVAVCCYGDNLGEEDGSISHIMCVDKEKCYLFLVNENPSMMKEGKLSDLLRSRDFPKVFHGCGNASKTLFEKFEVLLDNTNIYDTKVVYEMMKDGGEGDMKSFGDVKFCPDTWPKDFTAPITQGNEMKEMDRCVAILKAYNLMVDFGGQDKKYKKFIFEEVNGKISKEAIKEYKQKTKAKPAKPQCEPQPKKGKKKGKK